VKLDVRSKAWARDMDYLSAGPQITLDYAAVIERPVDSKISCHILAFKI
jgi:hypothetical protein